MRIAILDLGTNTFNLLVSEASSANRMSIIHTAKEPAKLGKGGIHKGIITPEAMERGITAIENHLNVLKDYSPEKIYAFGTSAIRDASNGKDFINAVNNRFGIFVHIIPGDREADFIYKGVRLSCEMDEDPSMILDIGGGSNEFIIANKKTIFWKYSFDLGMARMLEMFPPSDPIAKEEIEALEEYFDKELQGLYPVVEKYKPHTLIGASGSFETISALLQNQKPSLYKKIPGSSSREIQLNDYFSLHENLLKSTVQQRSVMTGMEPVRVEMIILATIFVNFVIKKCNLKRLIQSDYALKEGVIAEMLNL
jgi:exopolyphosphatase / guanosine-5'-triphosphate,3'-diphosphate pyrophosphatase